MASWTHHDFFICPEIMGKGVVWVRILIKDNCVRDSLLKGSGHSYMALWTVKAKDIISI